MSFVVAAALGILMLCAAPILAHLLRRGRAEEREFPPARLVPEAPPIARRRSRLEDRVLLAVRAAAIVLLAVLGATPLIRCSRLSLGRPSGGSIALGLVIDDSLSMRAAPSGGAQRFGAAIGAARELLGSARDGDAVAIVLAGRPARLALAATRDLDAARKALDELRPSDRSTDLPGAIQMARAALQQLPHRDRRVVLLSDLCDSHPLPDDAALWVPLAALREPAHDCGIASAERRGERVEVVVACNSSDAARGRTLEIVASAAAPQSADAGALQADTPLARLGLEARAGTQQLSLGVEPRLAALDVRLTGSDALAQDDGAAVAAHAGGFGIGVVADPATTTPSTGGATVVEQALGSLEAGLAVRPFAVPPEQDADLSGLQALIIDDVPGLDAEARGALTSFLERGGVVLTLLGPRSASARLGSSMDPFVVGAVRWEERAPAGVDPRSAAWLGEAAAGLEQLAPRGRARLDGIEPAGAEVAARWSDGLPFLLEQARGRGLAIVAGLPAALDQSDFALRPAFVALLDRMVEQAAARSGARGGVAGAVWTFPGKSELAVTGPAGPLSTSEGLAKGAGAAARLVTAAERGRYRVEIDGDVQIRVVGIDPDEILALPREPAATTAGAGLSEPGGRVDASREVALGLLALVALEVALRLRSRERGRRAPARTRTSDAVADRASS